MPEIVWILAIDNITVATVEDKNIFIQLLMQKYLDDSYNEITNEKASAELWNLTQKEDKDLYIYYYCIESLLKRIHERDQITNSGKDIVMLSLAK